MTEKKPVIRGVEAGRLSYVASRGNPEERAAARAELERRRLDDLAHANDPQD